MMSRMMLVKYHEEAFCIKNKKKIWQQVGGLLGRKENLYTYGIYLTDTKI